MVANLSEADKDIVILPDGRFDIIFSYAAKEPYHITLTGLGTQPEQNSLPGGIVMFAVSFRLLAIEYLLDFPIADLLDKATRLPDDFWGITARDMDDFDSFCKKLSAKMKGLIKKNIDSRKQKLFELIYSSKGSLSVKELSEQVYWFKQDFAEWDSVWHELFENAGSSFIQRPVYSMPLDQTWDALPNLTLLGDAAHLMPPFAGEGVNMAMLDALELSECLTSNVFTDTRSAIAAYEEQMRARARAATRESLENTTWMHAEKMQ